MIKYFKSFKEFIPTWIICIFMFFWVYGWTFVVGAILLVIQKIQINGTKKTNKEYEELLKDYSQLSKDYDETKDKYEKLYNIYTETINRYVAIDYEDKSCEKNINEIEEDQSTDNSGESEDEFANRENEEKTAEGIGKIKLENIDKEGEIENESPKKEQQNIDYKEIGTENHNYEMELDKKPENECEKPKEYHFPPYSRLAKGKENNGSTSEIELKEIAKRLQDTLSAFGVRVTVTDITRGPLFTRFEMQPELGVKISKVTSLSDDIKFNLAAKDVRIEAPIPDKAAIGIEIPNKEKSIVAIRDLLESKEFKEFPSNLTFAVGKDIAGKIVVADIAKMPHLLIAGTTGSGKSVCIDSIIISVIYKAHPDDVKLIMIDSKGATLNVYNGIPHLLIPVVTDPKKATAALHWGVAEMVERYKKFSDYDVKNLEEYNKKIEFLNTEDDFNKAEKLPQILLIVDDLSDLMAANPVETEESIVRLAQMARAAGIHIVIATQRPSADVITGLIKSNIPSRISFSVFSAVDSRVILDEKGAEKLLGNGDMLFKLQGYPRLTRIQGAYVSDKEISDIVEFLRAQSVHMGIYHNNDENREEERDRIEYDQYFEEAGRFIIEKDKASIGMLQRVFKIGFNRAARIMDELCEAGVVGEEEGTKPRKVLMSLERFEEYIENNL